MGSESSKRTVAGPVRELSRLIRRNAGRIGQRFEEAIEVHSKSHRAGAKRACRAWLDDLLYELAIAERGPDGSAAVSGAASDDDPVLDELLLAFYHLPDIILAEAAAAARRPPGPDHEFALRVALTRAARRAISAGVNRQARVVHNQAVYQKSVLDSFSHELHGNLNAILMMLTVVKEQVGTCPQFASVIKDLDILSAQLFATVEKLDHRLEQNEIVASASAGDSTLAAATKVKRPAWAKRPPATS
jgi:hypothetical protein